MRSRFGSVGAEGPERRARGNIVRIWNDSQSPYQVSSITVSMQKVSSHVEVSITDTGQGIEPAVLPHIFERFRQVTRVVVVADDRDARELLWHVLVERGAEVMVAASAAEAPVACRPSR
jgi:hypothetical protein